MRRWIILLAVADTLLLLLLITGGILGTAALKMEQAKLDHELERGRQLAGR